MGVLNFAMAFPSVLAMAGSNEFEDGEPEQQDEKARIRNTKQQTLCALSQRIAARSNGS
ncbi:MAG: hypothetical protein ACLSVD_11850 [Eggerthellaceae bacterium]